MQDIEHGDQWDHSLAIAFLGIRISTWLLLLCNQRYKKNSSLYTKTRPAIDSQISMTDFCI
jgi:hypothetical protein